MKKKPVFEMSESEIEEALFSQVRGERLKVAMVIVLALGLDFDDADVVRIDLALEKLVAERRVVSFGKVANWRHSEIARA